MTIYNELRSFYKRRIAIPVKKGELVLDIGSGDKPHWRSDILVDQYIDDSYGIQRSGSSKVVVSRPLIVAPVEAIPFKDKVFDYVICSHILEHVMDPKKAIKEITRVGKAGYIEVPFEGAAKIIDVPSHLWYCRMEKNTLVMTAKESVAFDDVIDSLMSKHDMLYGFAALGQKNWDDFIIQLHWKDTIQFRITGKASKKLFKEAQNFEVIHDRKNFFLRNSLTTLISLVFFYKKNNKRLLLSDIMRCPKCKKGMRSNKNRMDCNFCKTSVQVMK